MSVKHNLHQLFSYLGLSFLILSIFAQSPSFAQKYQAEQTALPVNVEITEQPTPFPEAKTKESAQPVHITIPGVIDTKITSEYYEDGTWSISPTSASHLSTSASPGEPDNIIIYGHNTKSIFGPIRWLTGTEEITVTLADGSAKVYTIAEMNQVTTDQVQYLHSTDTEVLTLYTCAGPFDSERFIVRAVPKTM